MIRKLNKVRIPMKEATQYDESGHPRRSRQATLVFSSITLLPPPV